MLKAVIFDFDGLIIDTELPEFETWRETFQAFGGTLNLEKWLPMVGSGTSTAPFDIYAYLEEQAGRTLDKEAIRAERQQRYLEKIATQPLLPGVEKLIYEAHQQGIAVAVASSSTRSWVEGHLKERGLLNYFHSITTADEVEFAKPRPDIYLKALQKLNIQPHEAIALEDSLHGMRAAKAAGIYCIVVPNTLTRHFDFSEADRRISSIAELSLANLLQDFADADVSR
ncbi:HAD superfamily hydrolase (TIGR01509 family)/HAD superfamily hydrolase (TIGR01549 family) [Thermosporothrix hazakensis]|jgi:HAD superfamily hydrolase (TIGR01509 family)|uniref:HAD superfamily hydrolase (TIGR01509 family)/HAD superfamily hydrolase (TIGR01549 family) n=2 Tax=Thermosporothrix TaxID=768650 RepID=A0A326UKW2_THEHA|nr:HAD family hydrolase [Thermosporothrix hazakensis]PZW29547.1 HAD superfamily hydrolase (TIGR01509 family)/HAD superfamily hydrolase (TIGR01549 family) [Thermosporothrix hazakensis]BBH85835.1 hypothetical protein KTC_05860 [Thermosporothrix sp. COM3]GCE45739.1 hypothetical protein KTH_06080 [Thermosporothrix hazakensis]